MSETQYTLKTQGLIVASKDREYFQGLVATAKDPMMIAFYQAWIRRYNAVSHC
jgi:hypothetical protein